MSQIPNTAIAVIGIDIGKNSFTSWATTRAAPSCCGEMAQMVKSCPDGAKIRLPLIA